MSENNDFVHLHNHTEYSFLDGAIRIPDLVAKAKEWKMPALGISDHGGLFGAVEFYDACKKEKIKPVLGFEAYVAPGSRKSRKFEGEDKNYHLVLFAKNNEGWKNLLHLSSIGYIEGFYYKPRVDMEVLRKHSEGIIATTACIAGAVPKAIIKGDRKKAKSIIEEYLEIFGEGNFYLELQKHGIKEEVTAMEGIIDIGKEMGIPFIVTNDAHYLNKEDAKAHEILLCIQSQSKLSDPDHYSFSTNEMYLRTPEEMAGLFPEIPEAMKNTMALAEKCNVDLHEKPQLPFFEVPSEFKNTEDYLRDLAYKGLKEKYPEAGPEINERLKYELDTICKMEFPGYFLIVLDFLKAADKMKAMRGCRGSAAGSLVAFCIGITNVDPIKYDLIFERFLNPERVSMPDIDADIADDDRYRIINYVIEKYGRNAVCQIINFGRMKAKAVLKDVARAMGIPFAESNKLSSMVNEKTLKDSIRANGELKAAIESNPTYKELLEYAEILEGLVRQPGMHAGGIIIAPGDVVRWSPLFKQSKTDIVMTQFDMTYIESIGLIKIDILGLRTFTVLQKACKLIEDHHKVKLDLWNLDDCNEKTFKLFQEGKTTDIFQFESQGMQDYLRKLKPNRLEDLIAMTALHRPGPMKNIDSFIHRKHGKENISYPHSILKEILDVTYGIIVYQEQVMRIAQKMGGFTLGQADILRKAMGKKKVKKMTEMRLKFLDGAKKKNIKLKDAEGVWKLMERFAEYGFNKAHATVYAHVSYQAAYLKTHYPLEYMTAVLSSHIGEKDKFIAGKNEAENLGLKVLPPDINSSEMECNIHNKSISLGLAVISNIGKAAEAIVKERSENGVFKSIFEFCRRVDMGKVNKKALESLIMAGAMDSIPGTRTRLFAAIEKAVEYGQSFQKDKMSGQTNLFIDITDNNGDSGNSGLDMPEPELPDIPLWSYNELLAKEKEVLNFYLSGHPLDHYKDEIAGFSTITLSKKCLANKKDRENVVIGGVLTEIKKIIQKNGREMAFLQLEDFEETIELIAFADVYEQFRNMLAVDSMVLVRGRLQKKEGEYNPKIVIEKVMLLSDTREKLAKTIHLRIKTQGLEEDFLHDIKNICSENKGECKLIIHIVAEDESEYKIRAKHIEVSPDRKFINSLRSKMGKENVWLSQKAA